MDTATGKLPVIDQNGTVYSSEGPADSWAIKNDPPEQRLQWCYLFDLGTCNEEQLAKIEDGTAPLKNYIYVDANSTKLFPETVGGNGTHGPGYSPPPTYDGSASGPRPATGGAIVVGMIAALAGFA